MNFPEFDIVNAQIQGRLTVIIPTHNRPAHLRRILSYLKPLSCSIIVADSSDFPYEGDVRENVTYFYTPNLSFLEKLKLSVGYVKSTYLMFHADDDFVLLSSIPLCLDFLDINHSYSCVQGHLVGFSEPSSDPCKWLVATYETLTYANIYNNPIERVLYTFANHCPLLYSVARTEVLSAIVAAMGDMDLSSLNKFAVEWLFQFGYSLYGKNKFLPILYMAREQKEFPQGPIDLGSIDIRRDAPFPRWYSASKQADENSELYKDYTKWIGAATSMLEDAQLQQVDTCQVISNCARNLVDFYRMHYERCTLKDWHDYLTIWGNSHERFAGLGKDLMGEDALIEILKGHVDRRFNSSVGAGNLLPADFKIIVEHLKKHHNS